VTTEKNADWIDWVSNNIPILPLNSWDDAAGLVTHLLNEKGRLEAYRNKVLESWMLWKNTLVSEMKELVVPQNTEVKNP